MFGSPGVVVVEAFGDPPCMVVVLGDELAGVFAVDFDVVVVAVVDVVDVGAGVGKLGVAVPVVDVAEDSDVVVVVAAGEGVVDSLVVNPDVVEGSGLVPITLSGTF